MSGGPSVAMTVLACVVCGAGMAAARQPQPQPMPADYAAVLTTLGKIGDFKDDVHTRRYSSSAMASDGSGRWCRRC